MLGVGCERFDDKSRSHPSPLQRGRHGRGFLPASHRRLTTLTYMGSRLSTSSSPLLLSLPLVVDLQCHRLWAAQAGLLPTNSSIFKSTYLNWTTRRPTTVLRSSMPGSPETSHCTGCIEGFSGTENCIGNAMKITNSITKFCILKSVKEVKVFWES